MHGFSLISVLVISLVISVLGSAGLYISMVGFQTTRADLRYNMAEKAANYGLLQAVDNIYSRGYCDIEETYNGSLGGATYQVRVKRQSYICFVRAEGRVGRARVIKTALIQSYYGIGLYTARGNVSAQLNDGVRLSGCDNSATPTCYVPAFVASGTVDTSLTEQACSNDSGGPGLYGQPAIIQNVILRDLIPLFFNVNCFNVNDPDSPNCDVGLLQVLENEYGINPYSNIQEMFFDNEFGVPRLDINFPEPDPACSFSGGTIDLSTIGCSDIYINSYEQITITGSAPDTVNIYVNIADGFNHSDIYSCWDSSTPRIIIENAENFNLLSNAPIKIEGSINNFRIVSYSGLNVWNGAYLQNGIVILGPQNVENLNDVSAPYNMIACGDIVLDNVKGIIRHIRFGYRYSYSRVYILDSFLYLYAYGCRSCSRDSDTSSLDACYYNDVRWCGWANRRPYVILRIGRDWNGYARPSIIFSNNSTVYTYYPYGTAYIWGAFVGQDITYLVWYGSGYSQDFKGFLVRNFPTDRTLRIRIGSGFSLEMDKSMLDRLSDNFWFFRKVDCQQMPPTPLTSMILTRSTSY